MLHCYLAASLLDSVASGVVGWDGGWVVVGVRRGSGLLTLAAGSCQASAGLAGRRRGERGASFPK